MEVKLKTGARVTLNVAKDENVSDPNGVFSKGTMTISVATGLDSDVGPKRRAYEAPRRVAINRQGAKASQAQYTARALQAYRAANARELSFSKGQTVNVIKKSRDGMWQCEINGKRGLVREEMLSVTGSTGNGGEGTSSGPPVRRAGGNRGGRGGGGGGGGGVSRRWPPGS